MRTLTKLNSLAVIDITESPLSQEGRAGTKWLWLHWLMTDGKTAGHWGEVSPDVYQELTNPDSPWFRDSGSGVDFSFTYYDERPEPEVVAVDPTDPDHIVW